MTANHRVIPTSCSCARSSALGRSSNTSKSIRNFTLYTLSRRYHIVDVISRLYLGKSIPPGTFSMAAHAQGAWKGNTGEASFRLTLSQDSRPRSRGRTIWGVTYAYLLTRILLSPFYLCFSRLFIICMSGSFFALFPAGVSGTIQHPGILLCKVYISCLASGCLRLELPQFFTRVFLRSGAQFLDHSRGTWLPLLSRLHRTREGGLPKLVLAHFLKIDQQCAFGSPSLCKTKWTGSEAQMATVKLLDSSELKAPRFCTRQRPTPIVLLRYLPNAKI